MLLFYFLFVYLFMFIHLLSWKYFYFIFIDEKIVQALYLYIIYRFSLQVMKHIHQHNTAQVCATQSNVFHSRVDTKCKQPKNYHTLSSHNFIFSLSFILFST